jgi:selenocysteine lyase/cysteine desulfurase
MDPSAARSLFPLTRRRVFLDHAGVAPLSDRGRAAIESLMERLTDLPYAEGLAEGDAGHLRASLARLLGAEPDAVALVRSAGHGLGLVARGLDWQPGDNVVVEPATAAWAAPRDPGVELRTVEPGPDGVAPAAVLDLVDDRTRMVALAHVAAASGRRLDVDAVGGELDRRGVIFALDGSLSAGALRLELSGLPVDVFVAGASRWLLGPLGMGVCYCRPELLRRLRPLQDHVDAPRDDLSILDVAAFQAAVDLLLEVGPETIEQRVLDLTGRLAGGLAERGHEIAGGWPRPDRERSGIVGFKRPGAPAAELLRDLAAARVVAGAHADGVRFSPHFYNTDEEIERVLDVLTPPEALQAP